MFNRNFKIHMSKSKLPIFPSKLVMLICVSISNSDSSVLPVIQVKWLDIILDSSCLVMPFIQFFSACPIISIFKISPESKHFSTSSLPLPYLNHNYYSSRSCNSLPNLSAVCCQGSRRSDPVEDASQHVTALHRIPQCLPVSLRVKTKVLTVIYKAQHNPL